ncbi:hypothetical protein AAG570_005749 [Ranatra chinensis]|uniref:Uncharacterized protein n=1 Tax=Ranatra chinensis TaxID=642074 RepID=A0ABD0YGQ2_9HEMI
MNTVKTIRHELETCNGDYEDVARSELPADDLIAFVQQNSSKICRNVLKNPGIGIRASSREMNVAASTMKLALNEDLRHYSCKRRKGQLLTEKAREKRLISAKKLLREPQTTSHLSAALLQSRPEATVSPGCVVGLRTGEGLAYLELSRFLVPVRCVSASRYGAGELERSWLPHELIKQLAVNMVMLMPVFDGHTGDLEGWLTAAMQAGAPLASYCLEELLYMCKASKILAQGSRSARVSSGVIASASPGPEWNDYQHPRLGSGVACPCRRSKPDARVTFVESCPENEASIRSGTSPRPGHPRPETGTSMVIPLGSWWTPALSLDDARSDRKPCDQI